MVKSQCFKNAALAVRVVGAVFVLKNWVLGERSGWVGFATMRVTFEKRSICNYPYDNFDKGVHKFLQKAHLFIKFEAERIYGRGRFFFYRSLNPFLLSKTRYIIENAAQL